MWPFNLTAKLRLAEMFLEQFIQADAISKRVIDAQEERIKRMAKTIVNLEICLSQPQTFAPFIEVEGDKA